MAKTPSAKATTGKSSRSRHTIGFHLDPEDRELFTAIAEANSKSVGLLAKEWILERLGNPQPAPGWEAALQPLHGHLIQVRRELARSVEAILIATGRVTEAEARAWVDEQIRHKPHALDQQSDQGGKLG